MSQRKESRAEKVERMRSLLFDAETPGLSLAEFARQHDLSPQSIYWWRKGLRDEFAELEIFTSLEEACFLANRFRDDYNHHRPHSALDGQSPSEFAADLGPSGSATLRLRAQDPGHLQTTTTPRFS